LRYPQTLPVKLLLRLIAPGCYHPLGIDSKLLELHVRKPVLVMAILGALCVGGLSSVAAVAQDMTSRVEYIDIRWDGTDRMCIVFPDGRVEFVGKELEKVSRPDDANKRAFYMTLAMNKMAAQGYEFVGMISDEIVMKRRVPH
jgi:hypothetical protein